MNQALENLVNEVSLTSPDNEAMRLTFGLACVERVRHLLEEPQVVACLDALGLYVRGEMDRTTFDAAHDNAARLANQHPGSKSIDGTSHAAVSATYAVANALAGKALQGGELRGLCDRVRLWRLCGLRPGFVCAGIYVAGECAAGFGGADDGVGRCRIGRICIARLS